ncbi:putative Major facilitator superfamily (MFS) profile domain-containing protein [Seiridium cardinale]|uniref:Quinate transporter n=1 Tax=Seiridium cardinale TaxID=138064 RepID=A0ABR2XAA5_9PEZI
MRATRHNQSLNTTAPEEVYNFRVYLLALISSMGAVMFGYGLGFIGTALGVGIVPEKHKPNGSILHRDFGTLHASASEKSACAANVLSLLQAGCVVGSLGAGPLSDRFGRRVTLAVTALFNNVGSAIQTGSHGSEALMLVGRAIGGVGVGAASMIIPLYVAEAAPPHIRGALVGIYEIGVSGGTLIGFWINYGLSINLPPTSAQWIISFAVQLIPGGLSLVGLPFIPESPRWLARTAGREACVRVLLRLRNIEADHPFLLEEVNARNRNRLATGSLMFIFMQMAGSNAIDYYSPAIFNSIGLIGSNPALFATGIYGLVRFVAIVIAMLFVVDRFERTRTLMVGSAIMALAMWFIGAYIKIAAPSPSPGGSKQIDGGGYAAVVMIYLYAVGWCFCWAGIPWIYVSEIFPLRIRSPCVSICVAIHWVMNFVIARSVPYMITNIGFGTYFVFAAFMTIAIPWIFFCVPETKNLSLEEMDELFGVNEDTSECTHRGCVFGALGSRFSCIEWLCGIYRNDPGNGYNGECDATILRKGSFLGCIFEHISDLEERSEQLALMGEIYRHAKRVIVWLGPSASTSDYTIRLLRDLGSQVEVDWLNMTMKTVRGRQISPVLDREVPATSPRTKRISGNRRPDIKILAGASKKSNWPRTKSSSSVGTEGSHEPADGLDALQLPERLNSA